MKGWNNCQYDGVDHLEKQYEFKKYSRALAYLNAIAALAESYVHHPRLVLEWGKLTVAWGTHESEEGSGVLDLDRALASRCDQLYEAIQKRPI